jgi:hypothetical protein
MSSSRPQQPSVLPRRPLLPALQVPCAQGLALFYAKDPTACMILPHPRSGPGAGAARTAADLFAEVIAERPLPLLSAGTVADTSMFTLMMGLFACSDNDTVFESFLANGDACTNTVIEQRPWNWAASLEQRLRWVEEWGQ